MQIKRNILLTAMTAMMAVLAADLRAQEYEDRGLTLGPRAQYFDTKDGDDNWSGGAQVRFFLNDSIALEGSIDYRREEFSNDTKVDIYPVQASLLAYIIEAKPVGLFALGGAGWYFTRIDPPSPASDETDDRLGMHAGGGVEFRLSDQWSLDSTYRYIWLEELETKDSNLSDKEFDDSGHMVTIGLNYNF